MSAGHEHSFAQTNSTRLKWALLLTGSFLVAEVVGGILTGSLALISDAAHMLTDAVALAIALAAINIARRPTNDRLTYGYHRFEILAAAFNAFLLFGVAFYILYATYERLNQPAEIQSVGMLVIAVLGLLVNLASMPAGAGPGQQPERQGRLPGGLERHARLAGGDRRRYRDPFHRLGLGRLAGGGADRFLGPAAHLDPAAREPACVARRGAEGNPVGRAARSAAGDSRRDRAARPACGRSPAARSA